MTTIVQDEEDGGCGLGQDEEPVTPGAAQPFTCSTQKAHIHDNSCQMPNRNILGKTRLLGDYVDERALRCVGHIF